MAAEGCHLAACFLYVLLVNIESFFRTSAILMIARTVLYKTGPMILSRTFSEKHFAKLSLAMTSIPKQ